jgi:hypothetical protein
MHACMADRCPWRCSAPGCKAVFTAADTAAAAEHWCNHVRVRLSAGESAASSSSSSSNALDADEDADMIPAGADGPIGADHDDADDADAGDDDAARAGGAGGAGGDGGADREAKYADDLVDDEVVDLQEQKLNALAGSDDAGFDDDVDGAHDGAAAGGDDDDRDDDDDDGDEKMQLVVPLAIPPASALNAWELAMVGDFAPRRLCMDFARLAAHAAGDAARLDYLWRCRLRLETRRGYSTMRNSLHMASHPSAGLIPRQYGTLQAVGQRFFSALGGPVARAVVGTEDVPYCSLDDQVCTTDLPCTRCASVIDADACLFCWFWQADPPVAR